MLPDMMLVATGMAMAFKLRGERRCALTWFGDGSTSRGDFHEAMNWAGVQRLPVVFVLENNQYAYSTPLDKQFAVDPVQRAAAYGFSGVTVDGNDAEAMFEATRPPASGHWRRRPDADRGGDDAHARSRRPRRHEVRAQEQVEEWRERDPIERQEERLRALGVDVDAVRAVGRRPRSRRPPPRRWPGRCPTPRCPRRRVLRGRGRAARRRPGAVERLCADGGDA